MELASMPCTVGDTSRYSSLILMTISSEKLVYVVPSGSAVVSVHLIFTLQSCHPEVRRNVVFSDPYG